MKAIGLHEYLPIEEENSLINIEVERPVATGRDILVKINAISVNPVDTKVRSPKDKKEDIAKYSAGMRVVLSYKRAKVVRYLKKATKCFTLEALRDKVHIVNII